MNLTELLQQLDPGAQIELFELDLTVIGGTDHLYFHAGTNKVNQPIVWQARAYQPFPIKADGFDKSTKGTLPRPRLQIANVTGGISALILTYDDMVGAKVIRRRTFAQYLDGQPGADPNQHLDDDIFFVERKVNENHVMVEFELSSSLDMEGVQLPSRSITTNYCQWKYRGDGCGYTGTTYFDAADKPVGSASLDVCSKSLAGCKARFGSKAVLPFGGFPAARAYKI